MEMDEKRKREVRDVKINNWRAVRRWNDPFIPLGLSPSISRLLILPILQLSLTSSTPTGLSICLITKWNASLKRKKKTLPSVMHLQIHHRQQTSQMWNHLYSQDKQRAHLHLPRDSNTEELTERRIAAGTAEICHSGRGLKLNVPSKVLQNRCWHKSGRFRNRHDCRDLAGGCWRTAVSKCDTVAYIRNTVT